MIKRTMYEGARALTYTVLLGAGLMIGGCAPDVAPEQESRESIAVDTRSPLGVAAGAATVPVQLDAANPVLTFQAILGAEYAPTDPATFELVSTTSDRGVPLTLNLIAETLTFTPPLSDVWDRIEFRYCSLADPSDCTQRSAHVAIIGTTNVCAPESIVESFRNSTADNVWLLGPNSQLTATTIDPEGDGWLRLSDLTQFSYSDALLNVPFASSQGVSMSFESAQWGYDAGAGNDISGHPGDGITFFLVDGDLISTLNPNAPVTNLPPKDIGATVWEYSDDIDMDDNNQMFRAGAPGGSLGYAQRRTAEHYMPGMKHGVIGVGFDASGYYASDREGKVGGIDTGLHLNAISLRGDADSEWAYLASSGEIFGAELGCTSIHNGIASCDTERPAEIGEGRYKSIVNIDPIDATKYRVTVFTQHSQTEGFVQRIDQVVEQDLPTNLKLGFTGSSGGSARNFNEIRDVAVQVFADLSIELNVDQLTPSGAFPTDEDVTLTYTVTNHLPSTVCAANVDIQLPQGFTASSQNCDASNGGPNATCGDLNTLGVTDDYIALGANGEVTITIVGRFIYQDDDDVIVSGRVTPGAGQGDKDPLDNYDSVTTNIANAAVLNDQTIYVLPDVPRTVDVLDGATPGGTPIVPSTAAIVTAPGNVTATILNGDLTVMLPEGVVGPVEITVTVDDQDGVTSAPATITVLQSLPPEVEDIEVWVPEDAGIVTVPIVSNEPGEVFTTTLETPPAKGSAVVQNNIVTVTPEAPPANLGYYVVGVEACNTVLDPTNCKDMDVTVVYNDYPSVNGGAAVVPAGGTESLGLVTSAGNVGVISTTTLINPPTAALGTCAIVNNQVTFIAQAGAAGNTAVCTVQVCEEKPANHCRDAGFAFEIVEAFTPTDDVIAGAQGATSTVTVATLLSNDGNVTASSFALVSGSGSGGSVSETGGVVSFEVGDSVNSASFQYHICAGHDPAVCEDVNVIVTVISKPVPTLTEVWTLPEIAVTVDTPFNVATDTTVDGVVAGGSVVIESNGDVTVTPHAGVIGDIEVPIKGCTQTTPSACATTTIKVIVNDYPTMGDVHRIVAPGQTQTVEPNADPEDVGAIDLSSLEIVHASSTEAQGVCSIEAGRVKYVANAGATVGETDTCVANICEQRPVGACVTAEFEFEIDASFNPSDDSLATIENIALDIETATLLNNDGGADDDTFSLVGTPDSDGAIATTQGGTVTLNDAADGYMYTPAEDFVGNDTFEYNVCSSTDAADCDNVTVTVFVNDLPTMEDGRRLVAPGQVGAITPMPDVGEVGTINGSSFQITADTETTEGTCSIGAGPDYDVTFTANANAEMGAVEVCLVEVCEMIPADACVITGFEFVITSIFDPTDDELVTTEEVPVDFLTQDLLDNDGGAQSDSFTLVGTPDIDGTVTTAQGGTVTPNEDGDGYVYTPSEGFVGEDTFQYNICSAFDGSVCEDVLVTVTVKTTPDAVDSTVWVVTGTPHVEVDLDEGYTGDDPIDSVTVLSVGPEDDDNNAPGTVTVVGGVITFTPNDPSAPTVYEADVEICDADAVCTEVTVTIIYNDPPVAGTPMAAVPEGVEGDFIIPFNGIIAGTTPGEIDGGWDESSVAVSNDAGGPFGESSVDLGGASCAMVDGALVYTVSDSSLTASPTCFVQVCELNPGPAGIDATDRACTVLELTPEFGDHADVLITGPADNSETEDTTPTVTGTGQPGTEVTITVDGEPAGTVAVDENGNWSWTPEDSLGLGEHTIVAKGENGSEDQITLTVIDDRSPLTPDPDVALTGGRMFGCVSTDESTPTPALLALFVGLGLVLRRRKTARR